MKKLRVPRVPDSAPIARFPEAQVSTAYQLDKTSPATVPYP